MVKSQISYRLCNAGVMLVLSLYQNYEQFFSVGRL